MRLFFPRALLLEDGDTHFPLAEDGTGIRAVVTFGSCSFVRLRRIAAPPPVAYPFPASPCPTEKHATTVSL